MTNTNPPPEPDNTPCDSILSSGSPPEATLRAALEERIMDVGISYHLGKSQPRDFRDSVLAAVELRRTEAELNPELLEPEETQPEPLRSRRRFVMMAYAAAILLLAAVIASPFLDFSGGNQANNGGVVSGRESEEEREPEKVGEPNPSAAFTATSLAEMEVLAKAVKVEEVAQVKLSGYGIGDDALEFVAKTFPSLKELKCIDCNISDAGLAHLASVFSLQLLDLYQCRRITDKGVENIGELSNLLRLSLTGFVGQTASFGNDEPVEKWGEPGSRLTDEAWKGVVKLKKLQALYLSGANVGDQFLLKLALEGSNDLEYLDLQDTSITDRNLALFHTPLVHGDGIPATRLFPKLQELNIQNARIGDKGLEDFVRFIEAIDQFPEMKDRSSIEKLTIGGDGFNSSKITGKGLAMLAKLPKLRSILVYNAAELDEAGYVAFAKGSPKLEHIYLNRVGGISDKALSAFAELSNLTGLSLESSKGLSNTGLRALKKMKLIEHLYFNGSSDELDEGVIAEVWHALNTSDERRCSLLYGRNSETKFYSPNYVRVMANAPRGVTGVEVDIFVLDESGYYSFIPAKQSLPLAKFGTWEGPNQESIRALASTDRWRLGKIESLIYYDCNLYSDAKYTMHVYSDKHGKMEHVVNFGKGRQNVEINWPQPKRGGRPNPDDYTEFTLKCDVKTHQGGNWQGWNIVIHTPDTDNNHNSTVVFSEREVETKHWVAKTGKLRWKPDSGRALHYTLYAQGYKVITGTIPDNAISEVTEKVMGQEVKRTLITLDLTLPEK